MLYEIFCILRLTRLIADKMMANSWKSHLHYIPRFLISADYCRQMALTRHVLEHVRLIFNVLLWR